MDDFFLRHDVYKDRDPDELNGKVNSDSEASDTEESLPASVHDPFGPWQEQSLTKQGKRRNFKKSTFTGPKGVLTDYKAYKKAKAQERAQDEAVRQAVLTRIARGYVDPSQSTTTETVPQEEAQDSDDEFLNELEDDTVLQSYCAKRIEEIKSTINAGAPSFGSIKYCSPFEFVDVIDSADPRTCILVHMSDEHNYVCTAVNQCLQQLCAEYPLLQVLVVQRGEVEATIRADDVPIFMLYRSGQQLDTILDVYNKLQGEVMVERLVQLLAEYL
ncbi:hypothetical protein AC1031_002079 [Aphanomyces cochlioides]|nr:hypothetical protein AC1031_002079 [Aphanomyces cochlioides]